MALSRVWSLFQDENGYCFWSQAISDLPGGGSRRHPMRPERCIFYRWNPGRLSAGSFFHCICCTGLYFYHIGQNSPHFPDRKKTDQPKRMAGQVSRIRSPPINYDSERKARTGARGSAGEKNLQVLFSLTACGRRRWP